MKDINTFVPVRVITDDMKNKLDSLTNTTQDDIEVLFIDLLDDGGLKFSNFDKFYQLVETTSTTNGITKPIQYLTCRIYITATITEKLEEYMERRDYILKNSDVINMLGYKYSTFNSTNNYVIGEGWINKLYFEINRVLWL